ncbi:MAG: UDP-N-acetylmuramate--L-alanine ligase [Candidatus Buchananbacteria bacterium]|nr:UDP-N-acetylmuramate--L-alanine ligase [Candidatus Buchananbacteria bacterium]
MIDRIDLSKAKKIFFIGLGGIGISASARILKQMGKNISGSDSTRSEITDQLSQEGINVFIPQKADNIPPDADLIVYTMAVSSDNPEKKQAEDLNLPQITYPQLLGLLMQDKVGIGVCGTDGKTTTTAMLGKIFMEADLDPTIVIGSKVDYLGGNSRVGESRYFIFESDEYKKAFHNYYPKVAAVTNIRADHLDVYKDLAEIKEAFLYYLKRIPKDGVIVINSDDDNSMEIANSCQAKIVTYAVASPADLKASDIRYEDSRQKFKVSWNNDLLGEIELNFPGQYNVSNALAAIAVSLAEGIDFAVIKKALHDFVGAWRRFENLGTKNDTQIITDYAHTPEGLRQVIEAAKDFFPQSRILFVFQPHQYNRTKNFFEEFVLALKTDANIMVTDIFYVLGRENPNDFDINSKILAERSGAEYSGNLEETEELLKRKIADFDVIMLIGAGDIYNVARKLVK